MLNIFASCTESLRRYGAFSFIELSLRQCLDALPNLIALGLILVIIAETKSILTRRAEFHLLDF